jgi:hypothetical protein
MGINVLNNTSSQEIITTAGASLTSGDLIINAESGFAFAASSALTIAQNNNTTAGTSALTANTSTGSANYYGYFYSGHRSRNCQLSNGTLVTVYNGNGTNDQATNVNIVFKTLLNGAPISPISISQSSVYWSTVRALSNGFVVIWANGSEQLRFAIYDNNGTAVLSNTLVSSGIYNYSETSSFDVKVTSNNEIVIAYSISGPDGIRFKRYNSSGVLQGTETTVEASSVSSVLSINTDTSGGFWIYYFNNTSSLWRFARYNSSGTLQGALVTVASTGSTTRNGDLDNLTTRLTGGNVVLMGPTAASGIPNAYVYNSSGTLVTTINFATSDTTYALSGSIPGICLTGTGFTIFSRGTSSSGFFWIYNANGGELRGRTTTAYSSWSSSGSSTYETYSKLFNLGNAGYAVLNGYYDSSSQAFLTLLCFTSSGTTVGSATVPVNAAGTRFGQVSSLLTSDGSVAYTYTFNSGNSQNYYGMYAVQRKSVIGVAQNTVSANSSVRIATTGSYTINLDFFAGGNFDQRTATVPGTKGTVTGTSAVLFGMS